MSNELSKTLWRTLLPVLLGAAVAIWLVWRDVDADTLRRIVFDGRTVAGLILAAIFVFGRDFGLAWRFHTIAGGDLSWKRAFRTDIMCAFTSAITPSVVGGSALAIFYLNREGIKVGRATSLTLTTLFLDELFFVIFCPLIILLIPWSDLFGIAASESAGEQFFFGSVKIVFWLVYIGICIWTAILYMAIIGRPDATRKLLQSIACMRLLKRFRSNLENVASNMSETSAWVKGRGMKWWLKVFMSTTLSWFSRYFVVNSLFWAFVPGSSGLLVFARQFVVWVVLMVSPTPGGSGISEWLFANYYGDLIGDLGIAAVLALVWRCYSYYIYLVAGCLMLPSYFGKSKTSRK